VQTQPAQRQLAVLHGSGEAHFVGKPVVDGDGHVARFNEPPHHVERDGSALIAGVPAAAVDMHDGGLGFRGIGPIKDV